MCNPDQTDFFNDPWLFDNPLAFKPTYLNMNIQVENIIVNDCIKWDALDINSCKIMFGDFCNWSNMRDLTISRNDANC